MNQENMTGNPTLDLLNQASSMNEFQTPMNNISTGNPTLDLLNQSVQTQESNNIFGTNLMKPMQAEETQNSQNKYTDGISTGNSTLDLLNQNAFEPIPQILDIMGENQTLDSPQFASVEPLIELYDINPSLQGQSQFVSIQPEIVDVVEQPIPNVQVAAFGNPVNQSQMIQQSPEELFGGGEGNSSTESSGAFNPFDFTN